MPQFPDRRCAYCNEVFTPYTSKNIYCTRYCSDMGGAEDRRLGAALRRAAELQAQAQQSATSSMFERAQHDLDLEAQGRFKSDSQVASKSALETTITGNLSAPHWSKELGHTPIEPPTGEDMTIAPPGSWE